MNHIKHLFSLVLFVLLIGPLTAYSQGQKFIFAEGLGGGILASANFDLRFKKNSREGFGARLGYTNTGFVGDDEWISAFPIGVNYIYGKNRSGLLLGFTTTFAVIPKNTNSWDYKSTVFAPEIGYRFRPLEQGFGFQVTWSPLFNTVDRTKLAWFGIGLGYSWR